MFPIAGKLADKVNPKIPIPIGVGLTFISMYMYKDLSLTSEYNQIIIPLVIRGFGMGFMFIPLSTIAINDISKEKMAQATGLFNTIRQVGGSFGVAILGTLLTRRVIFHNDIFGHAVNQNSGTFRNIVNGLKYFVQQNVGGTGIGTILRAKVLITQNLISQAIDYFTMTIKKEIYFN